MKIYVLTYLTTGPSFVALDAVRLSLMTSRLYRPALQGILAESPRIAPAIAFYVLYILGLVIFAVAPGLAAGRWSAGVMARRFVRPVYLYDLRPHQPGDIARLVCRCHRR
jgi:uncharacterized membrane protein